MTGESTCLTTRTSTMTSAERRRSFVPTKARGLLLRMAGTQTLKQAASLGVCPSGARRWRHAAGVAPRAAVAVAGHPAHVDEAAVAAAVEVAVTGDAVAAGVGAETGTGGGGAVAATVGSATAEGAGAETGARAAAGAGGAGGAAAISPKQAAWACGLAVGLTFGIS